MAVKTSIILGRLLVLVLIILQCFFLASYPAEYDDKSGWVWYAVTILFIPAVMMWWWNSHISDYFNVFIFWMLYMWLGLVPSIGIVFGRVGDKITSNRFWNPSTLKVTLGITPLLLLLTFHTKIATNEFTSHSEKLLQYSVKAVINLCDGIELVCVILDENEFSHGIPKHYKNTLIAFTCISYLWLPCAMFLEYVVTLGDTDDGRDEDFDRCVLFFCNVTGEVLETVFLGLRMGLSLRYRVTTSTFIIKNVLMIIILARQNFNICCDPENEQGNQEPTPRLPENNTSASRSAPAPSAPPPPFNPEVME